MFSRGLKATWAYLDAIVEILVEDRADLFLPGICSLFRSIHHYGCFGYGVFVAKDENQFSAICILGIIFLKI